MKKPTRVSLFDAILLDNELSTYFESTFLGACKLLVSSPFVSRWDLEGRSIVRFLIFANSVCVGRPTPGMRLCGVQYKSYPKSIRHVFSSKTSWKRSIVTWFSFYILWPCIWGRLKRVVSDRRWSEFPRDSWQYKIYWTTTYSDKIWQGACLLQLLLFMGGSRYRNVVERLLDIQLMKMPVKTISVAVNKTVDSTDNATKRNNVDKSNSKSMNIETTEYRSVDSGIAFINQQVVWGEVSSFFMFLIPFLKRLKQSTNRIMRPYTIKGIDFINEYLRLIRSSIQKSLFGENNEVRITNNGDKIPSNSHINDNSKTSEDDIPHSSVCGICHRSPIVMPYRVFPCGHYFCYYCIKIKCMTTFEDDMDNIFTCPIVDCGTEIVSSSRVGVVR